MTFIGDPLKHPASYVPLRAWRFSARIVLALLLCAHGLQGQSDHINLTAKVDRRVELLSIVFRLAGNEEYTMSNFRKYTADIDSQFGRYQNHEVVALAKKLADTRGVSFDAVMSMAISLSQPPRLEPIVAFTDTVPDVRWGKENALRFVQLLQQFYRDAGCRKFFAAHDSLYHLAEARFQTVVGKIDLAWYKNYYGEVPRGHFNLLIGMNNGGGNYGPRVTFRDGSQELYSIIGASQFDAGGMPVFTENSLPMIIHEFNHSFVNPVVDSNYLVLKRSAEMIYEPLQAQMKAMAYGEARTVLIESLVRAAVITYSGSHGVDSTTLVRLIRIEQGHGFVWMDELVPLLRTYQNDRSRYPTFRSFVPALEKYFDGLSGRIGTSIRMFENSCVHVKSIEPFINHATNVDTSTNLLTVRFDRPLDPSKGYSINYGRGGKDHFPLTGNPVFVEQGYAIQLKIHLRPAWEYSFTLTPLAFESRDGYPLKMYTVDFKTK